MSVYSINTADVVHEVIEGEAILINMKTGVYYSLDGVGGHAWEALQSGPGSAASLAESLAALFDAPLDELEKELARLLAEMQAEGLLRVGEGTAQAAPLAASGEKKPFANPQLVKYTDLEALLLLDPIHDVSEDGWPHQKPDEVSEENKA